MERVEAIIKRWNNDVVFKYGSNDCVSFAAEVYEAITNIPIKNEFKLQYNNKEEGLEWLKNRGYNTVEDAITDIISTEPTKAVDARYGDIVSLKLKDDIAVGVCKGDRAYFVSDKLGKMAKVPLKLCNLSWSIV